LTSRAGSRNDPGSVSLSAPYWKEKNRSTLPQHTGRQEEMGKDCTYFSSSKLITGSKTSHIWIISTIFHGKPISCLPGKIYGILLPHPTWQRGSTQRGWGTLFLTQPLIIFRNSRAAVVGSAAAVPFSMAKTPSTGTVFYDHTQPARL
jgi:hypothetical protein